MSLIGRFDDDSYDGLYKPYEGLYDSGNRYETADNDVDIVQDLLTKLSDKKVPEIGEKWFVKINGSLSLAEVKIEDLTDRTVLLCFYEFLNPQSTRCSRLDVEFIEKIKE